MAAEKIRVGIVGLNENSWGARAHLPALRAMPRQFEATAVCTSRRETAEASARIFGIPHAFADPEALAQHPEVDLVAICVRVPEHDRLVRAALDAGKAVFCEWPLGRTTEEARALQELAERKRLAHVVGLQARGSPVLNFVKDLVAQGAIGRVLAASYVYATQSWRGFTSYNAYLADRDTGATALTIPAGHSIDVLCYCLGEFRSVQAMLKTQRPQMTIAGTGETVTMTSPDQVLVQGELASGAVASVHIKAGSATGDGVHFEINGTEGDLVVSAEGTHGIQHNLLTLRGTREPGGPLTVMTIPDSYRHVPPAVPEGPPFNVGELYLRIARAMQGGPPAQPDFAVAVARHRLLDTIRQASATGHRQTV